jgi:rubrerythrin
MRNAQCALALFEFVQSRSNIVSGTANTIDPIDVVESSTKGGVMSRLNVAPETPVLSLDELLVIARTVRKETARRYAEAAGQMREHGSMAAAEIFERLATEDGPQEANAARGLPLKSVRSPNAPDLRPALPETFGDEIAEMATSRLATPYRALAAAVRNAERVFAFWTYLAAYAPDAEVRMAAEVLAQEELDHVARLRRERRRAYRAERIVGRGQAPPVAAGPSVAARLERRVADGLDRLAEELAPANAVHAREFAREARSMAAESSQAEATPLGSALAGKTADTTGLLVTAERLVEHYLDAADAGRDEAAVARAQSLARRAIARLAWLGTASVAGAGPDLPAPD